MVRMRSIALFHLSLVTCLFTLPQNTIDSTGVKTVYLVRINKNFSIGFYDRYLSSSPRYNTEKFVDRYLLFFHFIVFLHSISGFDRALERKKKGDWLLVSIPDFSLTSLTVSAPLTDRISVDHRRIISPFLSLSL